MGNTFADFHLRCYWAICVPFVIFCGCQTASTTMQPKKVNSFYLLYKSDTIHFTFTIDSSLKETPDAIQWGYLKSFEFKSQDTELFFGFNENKGEGLSRTPDSLLVEYLKSKLHDAAIKGEITRIDKIANKSIYGFSGGAEEENLSVRMFIGEVIPAHLIINMQVNQKKTGLPLPDILEDVLETLQIQVSSQ
mgnify:CR=1 FL=1